MKRFACLSVCCLLPLCVDSQGVRKDAQTASGAKQNGAAAPVATPTRPAFSDDITAVFRAVKASGLAGPKSEFESTAQYEARLASWKGGTKKYVFVVEKNEESVMNGYKFEYDADSQEMRLTVGSEYVVSDTIQMRSDRTALGTYVGSNAYGVKRTITRMVEYTYFVSIYSSSPFELFSKDQFDILKPAQFNWRMDPTAARATKDSLRIAFLGTIPSPEATEETSLTEPTISRPRQILVYSRTLPFSLEELRVLNSRTGATVASFFHRPKPTGGERGQQASQVNMSVYGDPLAKIWPPSNGPGSGGSIGSGSGGGVGSGKGGGLGPGEGGGVGGGVYRLGGVVTAPVLLYKKEPEYSEEARKAKYQGTVLLYIEVDPSGKATNIRVQHSLGLGLDEKAIEAVRQWKFKPGYKDGKPVTTQMTVEVNFRL
jgi:TonB family protein